MSATLKKRQRKKRLDYCCNICDEPRKLFGSLQEVIAHYRKQHPDDGYGLWDIGGDLGDQFSNGAMRIMHDKARDAEKRLREAQDKAKAYDQLRERWGALVRALQIGNSAMEAYRDAYEREKKP